MTREETIELAEKASTLQQIRAAQQALSDWTSAHPDDWGVLCYGEKLAMLEDGLALTDPDPFSMNDPGPGDDSLPPFAGID